MLTINPFLKNIQPSIIIVRKNTQETPSENNEIDSDENMKSEVSESPKAILVIKKSLTTRNPYYRDIPEIDDENIDASSLDDESLDDEEDEISNILGEKDLSSEEVENIVNDASDEEPSQEDLENEEGLEEDNETSSG